jgi:DNA-binding SARP family transcriptional activator/tetratricopeptide (TPR) repeat protein
LFGAIELSGVESPLVNARALALLAYLVLYSDQAHLREQLAGWLWPEAPPERARRWLSQTLYDLRQSLGEIVVADDERVRLNRTSELRVDVWTFDSLAQAADVLSLQRAADLYTGDLAPEIYDDWIVTPRLERRETYLATLETLTERLAAQDQLTEALRNARRLVLAEPLREHNQQTYLRLLGRLNRRAEALAHFEQFRAWLQHELNIEPLPETRALAAGLRREAATPADAHAEALPFVGRIAERAALIQCVEQMLKGHGGGLALEGEPGIGKSRLLRELAGSARWRNVSVLSASFSNRPAEWPLAPLQAALTAALTGPRRAQLEAALSAETLAACAPLCPMWRERAALPELPPAHQHYRFQHALASVLAELTRLTPLLFLLDDVHWADQAVWEIVETLVKLAPKQRLLLVLAWRRTEMEGRAEWLLTQAWEREGAVRLIALPALSRADVNQALPAAYQTESRTLWAVSGGNPFLLVEALHALEEGRAPETDLLARAQSLPAEARAALDCAAVLGRDVPFHVWAEATGLSPEVLAEMGDTLTARYFLRPDEDGYSFAHDLIQAALYQALSPEQKRHWHSLCAQAFAYHLPQALHIRAFHLDRAGQNEAASVLYRQAAEHDQRLGAYAEARAALNRALTLWPVEPSQTRAEMLLEAARLHFITNESEAQAVIDEAVRVTEALRDATLQTRAALLAGELAIKTGRNANARTSLMQALAYAQAASDVARQAEAHYQLGELALREGQMPEARAHYEQQLKLARQIGDRTQEAAALEGLGFALGNSGGAPEEVLRYLSQALELRRALGDRFKEAQSLLNLLSATQALGRLDEVLVLGRDALSVNESIGYARGAAIVRGTLAQAHCAVGQFTEARRLITAARDYFVSVNDPVAVGLYTDTLGLVVERSGAADEAEALLSAALEQLLANEADFFAALAQMDLGTLRVRAGREAEALPLLEQAQAVFEANSTPMEMRRTTALIGLAYARLGQREQAEQIATQSWEAYQTSPLEGEERQYYLWALWQLLWRVGRVVDAAVVLRAAYATLQAQAARLHDPALRQSFFEQVPVNREIVAAHAQLSQTAAQITARLVRATVPLGRALTEADYGEIRWTVNAPEDEAITDRTERRRFVLKRLLAEAAAQEAAPTDDDLARALGVSRRTILRDMQALGQTGARPARSTRKRKQ